MLHVLINGSKHSGKYVAIEDFGSKKVIADGESPDKVYSEAVDKGYDNPVVFFVPLKDMVQIY